MKINNFQLLSVNYGTFPLTNTRAAKIKLEQIFPSLEKNGIISRCNFMPIGNAIIDQVKIGESNLTIAAMLRNRL